MSFFSILLIMLIMALAIRVGLTWGYVDKESHTKEILDNLRFSHRFEHDGTIYVRARYIDKETDLEKFTSLRRISMTYEEFERTFPRYLAIYYTRAKNGRTESSRDRRRDSYTGYKNPSVDEAFKILGILKTKNMGAIRSAFRKKAKTEHPDTGGSTERFIRLQAAFNMAERYAK